MSLSIKDQNTLDKFWAYCVKNQYFNLGYPESADFDYTILERFLRFSINNCGDWSEYCNYLLNSFDFEKEVIEHFSHLYQIPFDNCWGYVTNGGTEGNMFGCYLARELFPSSRLYFSKDTHYSVAKIVKLLRIEHCIVESRQNGEMDYDDLISKIKANNEKHPIIFANIGTTVRGAIDNISIIQRRIAELGIARNDYYIHADAALSGMILPFVDEPQPYNFADGIDSISVSGHKMIGSPIPCGITIAKKENVDKISVEIDYIAAHDKTITGSRNGHTPIMLWVAAKSISMEEQRRRIQRCLNKAEYAVKRFNDAGIPAWRNKNSITVVFPKPSEYVWKKHCLAISGDVAHMITSAHHLDTTKIDALIDDVISDSMVMVV
ncbi:MAG: histidine decarboxylase [Plesiomonas sp.]|uniref:histidine decarboxylase n=1 Tax=Plesiomonas sp. TaxID=2486279 RepID=UPI003EE54D75